MKGFMGWHGHGLPSLVWMDAAQASSRNSNHLILNLQEYSHHITIYCVHSCHWMFERILMPRPPFPRPPTHQTWIALPFKNRTNFPTLLLQSAPSLPPPTLHACGRVRKDPTFMSSREFEPKWKTWDHGPPHLHHHPHLSTPFKEEALFNKDAQRPRTLNALKKEVGHVILPTWSSQSQSTRHPTKQAQWALQT